MNFRVAGLGVGSVWISIGADVALAAGAIKGRVRLRGKR
jgi:hypothetical protein